VSCAGTDPFVAAVSEGSTSAATDESGPEPPMAAGENHPVSGSSGGSDAVSAVVVSGAPVGGVLAVSGAVLSSAGVRGAGATATTLSSAPVTRASPMAELVLLAAATTCAVPTATSAGTVTDSSAAARGPGSLASVRA
jgi:hypothetical protein